MRAIITGLALLYAMVLAAIPARTQFANFQAPAMIMQPQGRLTLTSGVPVLRANVTAASTLYYDCLNGGNAVPYFNGSSDQIDLIASCEVSDAMVSAASAGQVVYQQIYDVWWVHGGANRICLAMSASTGGGGGWASDTGGGLNTRGTGYSQIDTTTRPYITNKNSITNCFNGATQYGPVSANQGTYLGTVYASGNTFSSGVPVTSNGVLAMNFTPAAAAGGGGPILGVFNAYNRQPFEAQSIDSTSSWTYGTATWRRTNGTGTNSGLNNTVSYVDGLGSSFVWARNQELVNAASCSGANGIAIGVALNWAGGGAAPGGAQGLTYQTSDVSNSATVTFLPSFGFNIVSALETSYATGTACSLYGSGFGGNIGNTQSLMVRVTM